MKRLGSFLLALVMLVSLTATVSASELHEFTAEDEPAEIYAILLDTYGKEAADDYKWRLLANAGIIDDFSDIDNHEIGTKDQYKFADRLIAADEANTIIRKANKTGKYESPIAIDCGFTTDDEPRTIYDTLLNDYGKDIADRYKEQLLWNAGIASITDDIDNYELGPKEQYETQDLDGAIWSLNRTIEGCIAMGDRRFSNPRYASPDAQVFDDVVPGTWYYEAINAMAAGGLLTGYDDGLFHPDDPITVGQLCTILAKIYGLNTTEWQWGYYNYTTYQLSTREAGWYPNNFTVSFIEPVWVKVYEGPDHWAEIANSELAYVAGVYKPIDPSYLDEPMLRRGIMFPMVQVRQAYYNQFEWGLDIKDESLTWNDIPDADACLDELYLNEDGSNLKQVAVNMFYGPLIDDANPTITNYARTESACDILSAYQWGITTGIDDYHTFNPDAVVTRAQLCQMLYNMKLNRANMLDPSKRGGLF